MEANQIHNYPEAIEELREEWSKLLAMPVTIRRAIDNIPWRQDANSESLLSKLENLADEVEALGSRFSEVLTEVCDD